MADKQDLEKVTLNLFRGDLAAIRALYPRIGAGGAVRSLVRGHLRNVEAKADQRLPAEIVEELEVEVL